ncbi:MAG: hypothetical protein ACMG6E_08835 [Candidatus Roizmanbacteria bacterium]
MAVVHFAMYIRRNDIKIFSLNSYEINMSNTTIVNEIFSAFADEDDEKETELSVLQELVNGRTKICTIEKFGVLSYMVKHHFDTWKQYLHIINKGDDDYNYLKSRLRKAPLTSEFDETRDGVSYDVKRDCFLDFLGDFHAKYMVSIDLSSILPAVILDQIEQRLDTAASDFIKEDVFPPGVADILETLGYLKNRTTIATRFVI